MDIDKELDKIMALLLRNMIQEAKDHITNLQRQREKKRR